MRAALLAITLLFLISGPMEARNKAHRPGYSVQGYVNVTPYYGGSLYFGTSPNYGFAPRHPGPGYYFDRDTNRRFKSYKEYKKYLKHKKKMLKKMRKQRKKHHRHDDYRPFRYR